MFNFKIPAWFVDWNRLNPTEIYRPMIFFTIAGIALLAVVGLATHTKPWPINAQQLGPRGSGLYLPRHRDAMIEIEKTNVIPDSVPYPGDEGYRADDVYENLKVLGDLNTGQFTRLMVNITDWVAPEEGCAACHSVENFADDTLYTKVVARRMLEMVRHINTDWADHVANTGVTCYTCHRGKRVPPNIWFNDTGPKQPLGLAQNLPSQNHPASTVGTTSLPRDPLSEYLEANGNVRIQSELPHGPGEGRLSIKQAEHTYALMIHISKSLGVNCDYCHNTRSFSDWGQSAPQRKTAWYGIRMARDLNNTYLNPLKDVFPPERLGTAHGDSPKINCATCHNGVFKPLFGQAMVNGFPELKGVPVTDIAGQSRADASGTSVLFETPPWMPAADPVK